MYKQCVVCKRGYSEESFRKLALLDVRDFDGPERILELRECMCKTKIGIAHDLAPIDPAWFAVVPLPCQIAIRSNKRRER